MMDVKVVRDLGAHKIVAHQDAVGEGTVYSVVTEQGKLYQTQDGEYIKNMSSIGEAENELKFSQSGVQDIRDFQSEKSSLSERQGMPRPMSRPEERVASRSPYSDLASGIGANSTAKGAGNMGFGSLQNETQGTKAAIARMSGSSHIGGSGLGNIVSLSPSMGIFDAKGVKAIL